MRICFLSSCFPQCLPYINVKLTNQPKLMCFSWDEYLRLTKCPSASYPLAFGPI